MLALEPTASKYDLHFSVGRIPIRIHPMFWLITGMLGIVGGNPTVFTVVLWIAAVLVSLLVHELGHALVAKAHGWPPSITLYGMGGVASYRPTRATPNSQILIAAAGPGAGFVLGGLLIAGVLATGHSIDLPGLFIHLGSGPSLLASPGRLEIFVNYLLFVNIFWGLINLAPIQPLDGGTIASALFSRYTPRTALQRSLQLGVGTCVALGIVGLVLWGSPFIVLMFGMLGYNNWQMLQRARGLR
ncbi:MAG: site-2 protease family protein [Nannocystaceae bacterium]